MRLASGIASLWVAGCAFGNSFYDCPQRQPSIKEFALIESAAKQAGVERVNGESLGYCRQRGDGTRYAKWNTEVTVLEDGFEVWKSVGCANEASDKEGWGCSARDIRGIRLRLSAARPVVLVGVPKDMNVAEATRLVSVGFSPFDSLGAADTCHGSDNLEGALRAFRERAELQVEWRLEAAEPENFTW